ncbi:FAD-dependent oxidoreductase [Agromyces endophyticus]|uniref:FAD-binding oxidoreductase n=1 Tax=Agromyces sp. H17E-10 TaxID=2932244 RepID=UPI001FD03BE9|nr:FAD-dependent oxidoreductase [Agromyces sp. H17E-10]UOQ87955.1 FAD-dependent oxidoreductase [Agromyces sp. H17E-10]
MNTPVPPTGALLVEAAADDLALSLREAFARLDSMLDGRLVLPGEPDWDAASTAWNLDVDQRPAAVVIARSAADVARTIELAGRYGLAVAPQGTGHNAGPLAADHGLADAILVRTHELRDVHVDVERRVARVEAGALWGDVVAAVAPHGLAALAGSSHDVGVVGYTLGGGVSWLARSHGLAANQVLAVELVTADGRHRRVDEEHDPDLFWAVRGGGGDFGVVTAMEFRLFPIAEVVAGMLLWPVERADEVAQAWAEWTRTVPDSVQSVVRILHLPPLPELPPFLSGRSIVVVEAVVLEASDRADALLAPLRALAPELDTMHPQAPAELLALHMDPPGPVPGRGDGMTLRELTPAAVRAFVGAVGAGSETAMMTTEIRHLGGMIEPDAAVQRAADLGLPTPGATAGFDAGYLLYSGAMAMPGADEAIARSLGRLLSAMEPWRAEQEYLNFAEHRREPERIFGGREGRLARLRAIKRAVDPTRLIRSNHPVG